MEAAHEADCEPHAAACNRVHSFGGGVAVHGERLLDEDMLACRRGAQNLVLVEGMRRRDHDGVDRPVTKDAAVPCGKGEAVLAAECDVWFTRGGVCCDESHLLRPPLDCVNQGTTPASKSKDRGTDHESQPTARPNGAVPSCSSRTRSPGPDS